MSVRTVAEGERGRAAAPDSVSAGEARSARAFEAARRHSRLVRILRTALIFGAVGGVAALTGLALYRTFGSALGQLSIGDLSIDGTKITMDRPRLTGARPDGGAYVINAAKAIQDIKHPTDVDLVEIDGDIVPPDRDTSSYSIDLKSAHIDFKTSSYSSREPVTVVTTSGASITADSGSARDNGKEITFEGHAKTTIQPNGADRSAGDSIKGTQP
jgi:lipopolysaccharide export system protein LptC